MLQEHTEGLKKLSFLFCSFENATDILLQHMHIINLKFQSHRYTEDIFELIEYRQLKKLEHRVDSTPVLVQSFERTFRDNPHLESLVLNFARTLLSYKNRTTLIREN